MIRERHRNGSGVAEPNGVMTRLRKMCVASTPKDEKALCVSKNGCFTNSPSTISNSSYLSERHMAAYDSGYEAVYAEKVIVHTIENIITKPSALTALPFKSRNQRRRWLWIFGIPLLLFVLLAILWPLSDRPQNEVIVAPPTLPQKRTVEIITLKKIYHYFVPSAGPDASQELSTDEIRRIGSVLSGVDSRLNSVEDAVKSLYTPVDMSGGKNLSEEIRQLRIIFTNLAQRVAHLEEISGASRLQEVDGQSDVLAVKEQLTALQKNLDLLGNEHRHLRKHLDWITSENHEHQSQVSLKLESVGSCDYPPCLPASGIVTVYISFFSSPDAMSILENVGSKDVFKNLIAEAIGRYDADKTGLPDYALEPAGGTVLSTRCTESYASNTRKQSILFGIPFPSWLWQSDYSPRTVIQPGLTPGECWAFKGATGYLVIQLSSRIRVTGVSYEHIPKEISPDGNIYSAPKKFQVLALTRELDQNGTLLGQFQYNQDGPALQYFPVEALDASPTEIIELRIQSNHGHPLYTCLYRFRVHGKRVGPGWPTFGDS